MIKVLGTRAGFRERDQIVLGFAKDSGLEEGVEGAFQAGAVLSPKAGWAGGTRGGPSPVVPEQVLPEQCWPVTALLGGEAGPIWLCFSPII